MLRNFTKNTSAPQGRHSLAQGVSPAVNWRADHARRAARFRGICRSSTFSALFLNRLLRRISHATIPAVTTSSTR